MTLAQATTPEPERGRYLYVDALRGVAAMAVVGFHVAYVTPLAGTFQHALPRPLMAALYYGDRGVEVFFVISGFVIAHSLRRVRPDPAGAGNFILRRQLRLDPPYWAMIAVTLVATAIGHRRGGPTLPGWGTVGLNLTYLQHVVRHTPHVVEVAWTLCLEIQFYLAFMAMTMAGHRLSGRRDNPGRWGIALIIATGLACLILVRRQMEWAAWLPSFWPYFAFGAVCDWAVHNRLPAWAWAAYAVVFAAATAVAGPMRSYMVVGLVTAASLYAGGRLGRLRTWGASPVLQYFGRLSYSLYLVHLLVATAVARVAVDLPHHGNRWVAPLWFLAAVAASVMAADVFHRLVERPSMRWASRTRRAKPQAGVDGAAFPVAVGPHA